MIDDPLFAAKPFVTFVCEVRLCYGDLCIVFLLPAYGVNRSSAQSAPKNLALRRCDVLVIAMIIMHSHNAHIEWMRIRSRDERDP